MGHTGIVPFDPKEHTKPVMRIWLESSRQAHSFIPMEYWESTAPLVEQEILPRAETKVYLLDGEAAGFLSLLEGDHIGALFVDPAHQNRGIGRELLEDCKAGRQMLTLAVYRQNRGAERFYRREGFVPLAEQTDSATGQPELLMVWRGPKDRQERSQDELPGDRVPAPERD